MRFDSAALVEEVVWLLRLAEQTRAEDRTVLLRLYNGNPPFDESTAEENNIQININDLSGPNLLSAARRQWDNAFLKPANFFIAKPDSGPAHKRESWSVIATKHANKLLRRDRRMIGQIRATGANTLLFGVGPSNWKDRQTVIPTPIPVGSLMIPSETEIDDFDDNLSYIAIFREWTPTQLYEMTHGPKVDPGWSMPLVRAQLDYLKDQLYKSPNSLAYQYMPERIEELIKQDKGYMGSDAVPTVDVWDFLFRDPDAGDGVFRRVILDWNSGDNIKPYTAAMRHDSPNRVKENYEFLYTSGKRKYADSFSEVLHCQFGDCSPYAPFKYHSIRSLGWMLWGVCELQNRLHCKFNEAVFEQLMWFFQTASNQDLIRLKKANFEHMGVIPQGVKFLTANERFTPNWNLIQGAFARNRQLMSDSSTSYTQDYDQGEGRGQRTATETMALVNASQALASGILELGYTYETFKSREMFRRLCIRNSKDRIAQAFQKACLQDGIPEKMLDADRWNIEQEQVLGGGNKTLQMAVVNYLNSIRRNLPPDGQRLVDHIGIVAATDQAELAEALAPIGDSQPVSESTHDAQLATDRIMRGLPFYAPKQAVFEDYVVVWLHDMGTIIKQIMDSGRMVTPEELAGLLNFGQHIAQFLQIMESAVGGARGDEEDSAKLKDYQNLYGQLMNHVKALAQQLQQAMTKRMGRNGNAAASDPTAAAKVKAMLIQAQTKAAIAERSAAVRTQQKQDQFERAEARKDQETAAEIARTGIKTRHELMANRLKSLTE